MLKILFEDICTKEVNRFFLSGFYSVLIGDLLLKVIEFTL